VALKSRTEAIHPGYGFLAENSEFASACKSSGLEFIGPTADVLKVMGEKLEARNLMESSGIRITPGVTNPVGNDEEAFGIAESIGYPIIIKASAGGGGIGMAIVRSKDELQKNIKASRSTSQSSFGSDEIFLEKYVEGARHIEFQILADKRGNIVHLGERECSVQRRYQKLIEEAPSPALTEELREKMGAEAIKAAKAAGYTNAGTIEFLFSDGEYYFNEVNARLQVEHPVTELVTGKDLVAEQIRIAAGDTLEYGQEDIELDGWAIECRINAEDPYKNFLPSPGLVAAYNEPGGPGVRVDSGVYEGFVVPSAFDPLIAKLLSHGRDRDEALRRMKGALAEFHITGIRTNMPFHSKILDDEEFLLGNISTDFISRRGILDELEVEGERVTEEEFETAAVVSAWLMTYPHELEKLRRAKVIALKDETREKPRKSKWAMAGRHELMERSRFHEA
jgi:pyruvate carboxylase subunit A